jgi:lipoate synthase
MTQEFTDPKSRVPKPKWLRVKLPTGENYKKVRDWLKNTNYTLFAKVEIAPIWANAGALVPQLL